MKFEDRFPDAQEYGDPASVNMTEQGWRLDYISSTFLDGWINYVEPVSAFVVSRYSENFANVKAKLEEWATKPPPHTKLGELDDDVFILARTQTGHLWFFWFDCDVSDCSIGCLDVDPDDHGDAKQAFVEYVSDRAKSFQSGYGGTGEAVPIPLSSIRGWVSFK